MPKVKKSKKNHRRLPKKTSKGTNKKRSVAKQAEAILRQEDERFRLLIDQIPAAIWTTDAKLVITSSVGRGLQALGLKPNQLVGTTLYEYLKSTDPDFLPLKAHLQALKGESITYDYEWEHKFYQTHIEPLRDVSGKIVGTLGFALDITETRNIHREYEQSLSLLQATLESTADGILVVNEQGGMVSFNQKFVQMWRVPAPLLQARDDEKALVFVLDQLKDPQEFIIKVRDLYAKPNEESYDILNFKDGRIFERFSQPQRIGAKIVGRVWSFRDVTDRMKAEEALRQRTDKALRYQAGLLELAKLDEEDLETALAKILEVDARTMGVERVSVWLFNADRSEIVCQDLFRWTANRHEKGSKLLAEDYPFYFQALEESRILPANDARQDPRTCEFAENYLKPLGITSMMDVPIRLDGEVIGILCHEHTGPMMAWTLEDQEFASSVADMVSLAYAAAERRKAEKALQGKSEELERSNKELEQFAYVASHDLQEPLHLILAFSDRLQGLCGEALGEKGKDYIQRMQRSAKRMRQLIDDLLQFSRVTTRAKPFTQVDLGSVAREVLVDLDFRLSEVGGKVEFDNLPKVFADAFQMRQLFQNLISNALKFRRADAPPRIAVHGNNLGNGFCRITVKDNGIGFEEKYLNQIFRPFSRLHSYFEYEGSGIGLAVCQKIVSRHGGEITAASVLGEGSVFTFTLPLPSENK